MPAPPSTSRAVLRIVEAGTSASCAHCDAPVKFKARIKSKQVICNVYEGDRWVRVEHYHQDCYGHAGNPYGEADASQPLRPKPRAIASAIVAA